MARGTDGKVVQKPVNTTMPILCILNLLPISINRRRHSFKKETRLLPIAGLATAELKRQNEKRRRAKVTRKRKGRTDRPRSESHDNKTSSHIIQLLACCKCWV